MNAHTLLAIPLLPLAAAIIAGLFGKLIGRTGAALVAIAGVAASCALAYSVWQALYFGGAETWHAPVYQ